MREAVKEMLAAQYSSDPATKIVEEMGVWAGSVRIDLAVINGELSGYELKSDRDTLERLPTQADLYSRVFDRVTLVVGKRHADKAVKIPPDWWGITIAEGSEGRVTLAEFRRPGVNPAPDPLLVAKLVWRAEAIEILASYGLAKGWRSKGADEIHERLATALDFPGLASEVRKVLKQRGGWLREATGATT
ncbi:MAG: sce7726 family protein [Candidatus Binataceae bacterium]